MTLAICVIAAALAAPVSPLASVACLALAGVALAVLIDRVRHPHG